MSWSRPLPPANCLAVDRADVVDDDEVALPGGLLDGLQARGALAQLVELGLHGLLVGGRLAARHLEALVLAERALGRTPISIVKVSGWPCGGRSPSLTSGSPTGWMPAASIASRYHWPSAPRTASSRTASRPKRWMTTGGGTLPLRKPGIRRSRPSVRAARSTLFCTSCGGTSASTRTRDSGSSVTVVFTAVAIARGR